MKNKLLQIINHYGVMSQLKYFQSEVFEFDEAVINKIDSEKHNPFIKLIKCINEVLEAKNRDIYIEHIAEEIADCYVMLEQFRHYYGISNEEILNKMNFKINRQLERIKNNE